MARCGCSGSSCSCLIVAGSGVEVSGSGIESNPYVIDVVGSDIAGTLNVQDTSTIDLTRSGSGSSADPYIISGQATVKMVDLTDVTGAPTTGDVPVYDGTSWTFAPPPTTPPGAVSATNGITGDGSAGNPLRAATSGTWGVAPLNIFGTSTLLGGEIYLDANGQLRARPPAIDVISSPAQRPSQYPGRVYVRSDTLNTGWSDGTNWNPFAVASPAMIPVPRFRMRLANDIAIAAGNLTGATNVPLAFVQPYGAQFHNPMGTIEARQVGSDWRYVALVDGVFDIEAAIEWSGGGNAGGTHKISLFFGAETNAFASTEEAQAGPWTFGAGPPSFNTRSLLSTTLPLRTGDYFRVTATNLTPNANVIQAAANATNAASYLSILQVGSSTRVNFTP